MLIEAGERTFDQAQTGAPVPETLKIQTPFTLEFDINRDTLSSSNTARFTLHNLSKNTRGKIHKDQFALDVYKGIELKAGYGNTISTIFKGNIQRAYSVRQGTSMQTRIEAYDAGFAFVTGYYNNSFAKGQSTNEILDDIQKNLPMVNKGARGDFPGVLVRGNSLSGNTADLARTLSNGGFFVDLETAHCLNDNDCLQGSLETITSASGLLGTPLREKGMIFIEMIFEPRLLIGQLIRLESITAENFNGNYKVMSIHHQGTISDSICGSATTSVGLWIGTSTLRKVG